VRDLKRALILGTAAEAAGWRAPDWYALLRAARYLGVAPWNLLKQNVAWVYMALAAERAEKEAEAELHARADRRALRKNRRG